VAVRSVQSVPCSPFRAVRSVPSVRQPSARASAESQPGRRHSRSRVGQRGRRDRAEARTSRNRNRNWTGTGSGRHRTAGGSRSRTREQGAKGRQRSRKAQKARRQRLNASRHRPWRPTHQGPGVRAGPESEPRRCRSAVPSRAARGVGIPERWQSAGRPDTTQNRTIALVGGTSVDADPANGGLPGCARVATSGLSARTVRRNRRGHRGRGSWVDHARTAGDEHGDDARLAR
jgi:hypothetical protein